ncbi:MAG: class I SAM-dependent methyltransferase [Mesorhizobium sp.]|nr:MAG: class I SAM-dependent methyltransferase [Mesorhizobium sp.]
MDKHSPAGASYAIQRRVAGYSDVRMDGIGDLLLRARDRSVFDIGCNRGMVGHEFAVNGAKLVHGCDNYETGIATAREVFADVRSCDGRFEVVDLVAGPLALKPFGQRKYDIVLCLATYHKLKRIMDAQALTELVQHFGRMTKHWFAWRGTSDKPDENEEEMAALDRDLGEVGLKRIHTSYLSAELGVAAIWGKA